MWCLQPQSVAKDKLDARWGSGAGLGEESREEYVLTERGALKVQRHKRRPEEERWNQEEFIHVQVLQREPIPERGVEVK